MILSQELGQNERNHKLKIQPWFQMTKIQLLIETEISIIEMTKKNTFFWLLPSIHETTLTHTLSVHPSIHLANSGLFFKVVPFKIEEQNIKWNYSMRYVDWIIQYVCVCIKYRSIFFCCHLLSVFSHDTIVLMFHPE